MNLTPLEKSVLEMMLEKADEQRETIKQQLGAANIVKREFTGVGFFTDFIVPADATVKRDLPDMELNGVGAKFSNLKHGAGFLLFIRGGVVSMLEGFTYDENWPDKLDGFELFRIN